MALPTARRQKGNGVFVRKNVGKKRRQRDFAAGCGVPFRTSDHVSYSFERFAVICVAADPPRGV